MKIVINRCFGGFGLSNKAIKRYLELCGKECYFYKQTKYSFESRESEYTRCYDNAESFGTHSVTKDLGEKIKNIPEDFYFYYGNIERNDANLIRVIEELGKEANGQHSKLEVVTIPDEVSWEIDEYDGVETIHECHRSWC